MGQNKSGKKRNIKQPRGSQRCCLKKSSGTLLCAAGYILSDVSKDRSVLIFTIMQLVAGGLNIWSP